jgi:hypothetical protein
MTSTAPLVIDEVPDIPEDSTTFKDPTKEDIVKELVKPSCFGTVKDKKELLGKLIDNRALIERKFQSTSNSLVDTFRLHLPALRSELNSRTFNANKAAESLYEANQCFLSYKQHARVALRQDDIRPLFSQIEVAVDDAKQMAFQTMVNMTKSCIVKLSSTQVRRKFGEKGSVPIEATHRTCILCNHNRVDAPDTNNQAFLNNELVYGAWQKKKNDYEDKKSKGEAPGRAPPRPKMNAVYYQCHCHKTKCLRNGGGSCLKCKETPTTYSANGACESCEICKCNCQMAYQTISHHTLKMDQLFMN